MFRRHYDDTSDNIVNITGFQKLIGKLIYLTMTRLDICYVVPTLSKHMQKPCKSHLNVAFRLLRYIQNCTRKCVLFSKTNSFDLMGFVDADWAKCFSTRRSST